MFTLFYCYFVFTFAVHFPFIQSTGINNKPLSAPPISFTAIPKFAAIIEKCVPCCSLSFRQSSVARCPPCREHFLFHLLSINWKMISIAIGSSGWRCLGRCLVYIVIQLASPDGNRIVRRKMWFNWLMDIRFDCVAVRLLHYAFDW